MATSRSRIPQLDGLRALAIVAVFLHHILGVKLLWMGVDLFFVLSGFLITGILVNERDKPFSSYIGDFYLRRAKRILPAYVVILGITTIVFGTAWLRYWYMYLGGMNFLLPLGLYSPDSLPLWSLAIEEQFYLFWPIAVYYLSRKHLTRFAIAIMIAAPLLRVFCTPLFSMYWSIYMLLPFRMDLLAAGALIALAWPSILIRLESGTKRRRLEWQVLLGGALVALAGLAALVLLEKHGHTAATNTRLGNFGRYEAALMIVTSIFLVALLGWGKRILIWWPLMWIGRLSYSIYLFHVTAYYLVGKHGALAIAALTLGYSVAMWYLVENPINRLGHKKPQVLITQS